MSPLIACMSIVLSLAQDQPHLLPDTVILTPLSMAAEAEKLLAVGDLGTLLKEAERLDFLRANTTGPVELVHRDVIENNSYVLMKDVFALIEGRDSSKPILLADFPEPVKGRILGALAVSTHQGRQPKVQGENLQFLLRPASHLTLDPPVPSWQRLKYVDVSDFTQGDSLPATHPDREGRVEAFGSSTLATPARPLLSRRKTADTGQLIILVGSASSDLQRARKTAAIWKTVEERLARQRADLAAMAQAEALQDLSRTGATEGFVGNRAKFDSVGPAMLKLLRRESAWDQISAARPDIVLRSSYIGVLIEEGPRSWNGFPLESLLSGH